MAKYNLKASQFVELAREYKDWQEKRKLGTRTQMWNFHWAAGTANFTIWAILYNDYTSRDYQGQAWCAMFGADIMVMAFVKYCGMTQKQAVTAAKYMYGGDLPYNCQLFVNQHTGDSRLNHTPAIGSPVIFWTGSKYGHWGTVTGVDSNKSGFTSVEGNTSGGANKVDPDGGAVVEKWHRLDSKTLFWHPEYALAIDEKPLDIYNISCDESGLEITASALNIRATPGATDSKSVLGHYNDGDKVYPRQKCFIDGKAWYKTDIGWISAKYLTGWVKEDNNQWWYVLPGYKFDVNKFRSINGKTYFFDNTGYMASSQWIQYGGDDYYMTKDGSMAKNAYIKSTEEDNYYWVGSDGIWKPDTSTPDLEKYQVVI